jgi:hypothetical protein
MSKHKIHRFVSTKLDLGIQHDDGYINIVCPVHPKHEFAQLPQFIEWLEECSSQPYDIWYGWFPLHNQVSLQATPKIVKGKLITDDRRKPNGDFKDEIK